MQDVFSRVLDAIDIETYLICESEDECKEIIYGILNKMGLKDVSIVFIEHNGPGARVRARGYIHKPGDTYGWLEINRRADGQ
ncbi:MAG TPA: hypothetical protein GXZ31_02755 [Thermoanaerobacterales bacterium]|nr:hypothetical protein [Thermoanaerobacterales bacterium]